MIEQGENQYETFRDLVINNYKEHYDAEVNPKPDAWATLLEPNNSLNNIKGACFGVYFASKGPLFSEQYLDMSLENKILELIGEKITRDQLVECGSFSSFNSARAGRQLVAVLPWLMFSRNIRYALVTITPIVRAIFHKLDIPFHEFCQSDISSINSGTTKWGTYYDAQPVTGVIDTRQGLLNSLDRISGKYSINEFCVHKQAA